MSPRCSTSRSGRGTGPDDPGKHDLSNLTIDGKPIFSFTGQVTVMINTTFKEQVLDVPTSFLPLLPAGYPPQIKIFRSRPTLDGTQQDPTKPTDGEAYVFALIQGSITLFGVVTLNGFLSFSAGADAAGGTTVRIAGAVSATIRYVGSLSGSLDLTFYSDYHPTSAAPGQGPQIVGRVMLGLQAGAGIDLRGAAIISVNSFTGSFGLDTFINKYEASQLAGNHLGTVDPADPAGALLATKYEAGQVANKSDPHADELAIAHVDLPSGIEIHIAGRLTVLSVVKVNGTFDLTIASDHVEVAVDGSIVLNPIGSIHVHGDALVNADGFVARFTAGLDASFGAAVGLRFQASVLVEINTTGREQPLSGSTAKVPAGFRVHISGSVTFSITVNGKAADLASASGSVDVGVQDRIFTLQFDVTVHLAGLLDVKAKGGASIYADDHPGLALYLDVSLDLNILSIIDINASGKLRLNTTGIEREPVKGVKIAANSFRLSMNGSATFLSALKLEAGFDIIVGGDQDVTVGSGVTRSTQHVGMNEWVFSFKGTLDFFGIAKFDAQGWVNSKGWFDIYLSAGFELGDDDWGARASATLHIVFKQLSNGQYLFEVNASGTAEVHTPGVDWGTFGISFDVKVQGSGWEPVNVSITLHLGILGDVSFSTTLGSIKLPAAGVPQKPIALGTLGSDGVLTLNVGPRAVLRGIADCDENSSACTSVDEIYTIDHVSGSAATGETVTLTFSGRTQTFAGVARITGSFGRGNDQVYIHPGVLVPVELHGGDGIDILKDEGGATATLDGGAGNDVISTGTATGDATITGGTGDDYVRYAGRGVASIDGGDGQDTLYGGAGADTITGGAGDDTIDGRGGNDAIDAGAGSDLVYWTVEGVAHRPVELGSGDHDTLSVIGSAGADVLQFSASGSNLTTQWRSSNGSVAVLGSLTADSAEELSVDAGTGADTVTIHDLVGSPTKKVTVNAGKLVQTTIQTTIVLGLPVLTPIVKVLDDQAADTIVLEGSARADLLTISSTNNVNGAMHDLHVAEFGGTDFTVTNTVRGEGDTLAVAGLGGDDTIVASGTGAPAGSAVLFPDLVALVLRGGDGNDRLIGSPFADMLDGGNGSDTYTGGAGVDTFVDGGPATDNDTLVETNDADVGLYGNLFLVGTLFADDGVTPFAQGAGDLLTDAQLVAATKTQNDPSLRTAGKADRYSGTTVAESITGIFETAILTGGAHNNTFVVNNADATITVGGSTRSVTQWQGHAVLDNMGNIGSYPERYVVTLPFANHARIDIMDTGGTSGVDDLIVLGTSQPDDVTLAASGTGGKVSANGVTTTVITHQGVERVELYLLGAGDAVTVQSTHVGTTSIETGTGDDRVTVRGVSGLTTIATGDGTDRIALGSFLGAIDAHLALNGGRRRRRLHRRRHGRYAAERRHADLVEPRRPRPLRADRLHALRARCRDSRLGQRHVDGGEHAHRHDVRRQRRRRRRDRRAQYLRAHPGRGLRRRPDPGG